MLHVKLGDLEYFNDETQEFEYDEGGIVRFEYSLLALYNWEAKYRKPFLKPEYKPSQEELMDFFMFMALDPIDIRRFNTSVAKQLTDYISETPTATVFSTGPQEEGKPVSKPKTITAEEIYALMAQAGVDISFEHRNLNRLFVVLRIIGNFNNPPKKMSKADIMKQNRNLNAQRKAQYKTRG